MLPVAAHYVEAVGIEEGGQPARVQPRIAEQGERPVGCVANHQSNTLRRHGVRWRCRQEQRGNDADNRCPHGVPQLVGAPLPADPDNFAATRIPRGGALIFVEDAIVALIVAEGIAPVLKSIGGGTSDEAARVSPPVGSRRDAAPWLLQSQSSRSSGCVTNSPPRQLWRRSVHCWLLDRTSPQGRATSDSLWA